MSEYIPFALPDIGEEEIAEVVDCLKSGWITTGPKTRKFEEAFANIMGSGVTAIAVCSATAGLHLALEAIGLRPGDEVIVPTHTFTATAEVVRYLGAEPVMVDVKSDTLNIDPEQIAAKISARTRAIIPVHFAGLACEMEKIYELARIHSIRIIEDAAHALPSTYRGKLIGSMTSDVTVFSFYATKTITTGEGGMLVTRDPEIAKRCRIMRLHGISRDAFDRYRSKTPDWYYEVIAPGFKYNLTDIASSIGIHQLAKREIFADKRESIAKTYSTSFSELPVQLPMAGDSLHRHSWHLYVLRLLKESPLNRDEFIEELHRAGIGCSVHFVPLHLHPYWRDRYSLTAGQYPVSQKAYEQSISLPIYSKMTSSDIDRVVSTVRTLLQ